MQEMVKNILLAMDDTIRGPGLDGRRRPRRRRWRSSPPSTPRSATRTSGRTTTACVVARDSYWDDVVAASRWNVADDRAQIGKPVDRSRWGMTPPTSNAYYNPSLNEIVFPAGILQPPAFDVTATDAVNYGAIGVVIGHEISHGFDDQGAQFDAQGRLNNWWTRRGQQEVPGARASAWSTSSRATSSSPASTTTASWCWANRSATSPAPSSPTCAYQKSREGKGPEPTIDGFTPEQQFFIAWGQWRGDETRPETQRTMVQGDPHPIAKYRVNGPLSNLPAFREAFQCKAGDADGAAGGGSLRGVVKRGRAASTATRCRRDCTKGPRKRAFR